MLTCLAFNKTYDKQIIIKIINESYQKENSSTKKNSLLFFFPIFLQFLKYKTN